MPNVLDRQFEADRPNQKWVADFTYLWTAEGWLYVAAVIDLFSLDRAPSSLQFSGESWVFNLASCGLFFHSHFRGEFTGCDVAQ
ncbi:hypothetical protein GCM10010136_34610 [Limoniibacter endophyticus]|uniref:Integrase-like protein n=1 Tax=Limoniibacter endophyticus TaxID=1565040 RepID=A0A8J3DQR6_9HYPH|nr:hypothetical protein GCM10010136_34610 [Limoniibacter endophyticus]